MAEQKAAFISIIGMPNAGKSTLMNGLLGMKLAITTPKIQTTRHRIMGILHYENCQMIFSDTPGVLDPKYPLQASMMNSVMESLEDVDVVLLIHDVNTGNIHDDLGKLLDKIKSPVILLLNKVDLTNQDKITEQINALKESGRFQAVVPVSALHGFNLESVKQLIYSLSPEHPFYFPEDQLTDKPERFFVSEIIREQILLQYQKEIPYAVEVIVDSFKEEEHLIRIHATIYVERKSQKGILIGKDGSALKRTATKARKEMQQFLGKKVFLEVFVKVREDWRKNEQQLRNFGYLH